MGASFGSSSQVTGNSQRQCETGVMPVGRRSGRHHGDDEDEGSGEEQPL